MSLFKKARETLAKEPRPPKTEPLPKPAPRRTIPKIKPISQPRYLTVGTENLMIRSKISDYAMVQSLVVDGRLRLEKRGYAYNERQMLWGMATALSTHFERAVSDQELVATTHLDSRMIRWAVEYGYLRIKIDREEANQAQELLSKMTGQVKRVRPELKVPVPLAELNKIVKAAGKEKDLGELAPKMNTLDKWIKLVVIPQLQAKVGLEVFE